MNGNSMFSNFTNISTTYNPNPFQPNYPQALCNCNAEASPVKLNKPYEILSPDRLTVLGYFWYYGNSVDLVFNLEGQVTLEATDNYLTVGDLINSLTLVMTIYNFRYEPIMQFSTDPLISKNQLIVNSNGDVTGSTITASITNELSSQLVKGIYYIDLVASLANGYNETLFNSDQIKFEVR